jgi:predicted transcriptional regulator of viral defense system
MAVYTKIIEYLESLPHVFSSEDAAAVLRQYYKAPLKALETLERRNVLVRLKRGHYAFAHSFDPMLAANLIYTPSYVSFETALAFYGLIPERTDLILSVVDGRPLDIHTPVGNFSYLSQSRALFALGLDLQIAPSRVLSIASREKALLDTLARANLRTVSSSPKDLLEYVVDGLRVDESDLKTLSLQKLRSMAPLYRNLAPRKLVAALSEKGKKR